MRLHACVFLNAIWACTFCILEDVPALAWNAKLLALEMPLFSTISQFACGNGCKNHKVPPCHIVSSDTSMKVSMSS